jgi:hypothetical protein
VAPSKKKRPKGEGKSPKKHNRAHKAKRQDEAVTAGADDMTPGAEAASTKTAADVLPIEPPTIMSTTETPSVPPKVAPSKKKRPKVEGGSPKKVNRVKQQDEVMSSENNDLQLTNPDDVSSSMRMPGTDTGGRNATRSGRPSTRQNTGQFNRDSVAPDPSTQPKPHNVALQAPNDDDQVEARMEERWRERMEEGDGIVAAEVKEDVSAFCGLKKKTLVLLGIVSVLVIIGGIVGGVVSSSPTAPVVPSSAPVATMPTTTASSGGPLLEELRSLNAISDDDSSLFSDPTSPQSQALAWMKKDTIVMSPGRSARDLLQRYVLAVLYYSTSGPDWVTSDFLSSHDVCSWNSGEYGSGVYCRFDGESVDNLSVSGAEGQVPGELGLLTNLESIDIYFSDLSGSIPSELSQLLALKSLEISSNKLSGTIPTEFGKLLSLESLNIGDNQLTGTIPTELGQLLSLETLDIRANQLKGTIPTELGQMLAMSGLHIDSNHLTGTIPTELGQLLSLASINLSSNRLTGTIPPALAGIESLSFCGLDENSLTGSVDQSFCANAFIVLNIDCDEVECTCCMCCLFG